MRFWKLKDGSAVEAHADHVDVSEYADEITEQEFKDFIASMPAPPTPPKPIDQEKLKQVLIDEGLIADKSEVE